MGGVTVGRKQHWIFRCRSTVFSKVLHPEETTLRDPTCFRALLTRPRWSMSWHSFTQSLPPVDDRRTCERASCSHHTQNSDISSSFLVHISTKSFSAFLSYNPDWLLTVLVDVSSTLYILTAGTSILRHPPDSNKMLWFILCCTCCLRS